MTDILAGESEEEKIDQTLRPSLLQDFIGQTKITENLNIFIKSSLLREKSLDHVLLCGPPGLGKTTLAQIIAKEMNSNIYSTSGPAIEKQGDLAAILTNLQKNSLLFIDEVHRLNKNLEETLYSAMEDYTLDIIIGQGPGARSMKINLPEFTLVGATTRAGMLSSPFRDRFGIPIRFDYYEREDLFKIIMRSAKIMKINIVEDAANKLASRSRGTPRIAIRLLKRALDFAVINNNGVIDSELINASLHKLEVDENGLDVLDRKYLFQLGEIYKGGPVGVSTLAVSLSEEKETLEDICEPYLIQSGLIQRTSRGRILTNSGFDYFKKISKSKPAQVKKRKLTGV